MCVGLLMDMCFSHLHPHAWLKLPVPTLYRASLTHWRLLHLLRRLWPDYPYRVDRTDATGPIVSVSLPDSNNHIIVIVLLYCCGR